MAGRKRISHGSEFEAEIGYSRAVRQGDWVFLAGTTGFNYETMQISEDPTEQTRQTFRNIAWALEQTDASFEDVVRVLYIVPGDSDWPHIQGVLKEVFGDIRPAATMIRAGLLDPRAKIEIEVTAYAPNKM